MEKYNNTDNVAGWTMTEKFDGVQGIWDGRILKTRNNNTIHVPAWWTTCLPKKKLIGELWAGRGKFDYARGVVMSRREDSRWEDIRFMIFDKILKTEIKSMEQFDQFYNDIIEKGGEGVVITSPDGEQYKRKPLQDSEGIVIEHKKGRGKNVGKIGALILRLRNGKKMGLGGLDNKRKNNPPEIGTIVRFKFSGFTSGGLPRFASFYGIRAETSLNF